MKVSERFTRRLRGMSAIVALELIAALMPVVLTASPAAAATLNVGYTLEGCNLDHGGTINTVTHICSPTGYTTGNLGKSWAELDKVPMRVTLTNNSSTTQSGQFVVAGDYKNGAGTATGWDQISTLTLNTAASDTGCPSVTSGAQTITPSGGGVGGADQTIYRLITASIPGNKTCVYDYTMRLALGAHLFSGSSLQGNLWNENLESGSVGQKRVSIPVAEIAPQEFSKVMSPSRGSSVAWSIAKNSNTASVNFANTCDTSSSRTSGPITVTVSWTKITTQSGVTTIVTTYTLTNPAHLAVVATVNDTIYEGTTQATPVGAVGPLIFNLAPGETESQTATTTTNNPALHFNDVATATYTVDGEPVPGSLTATDSKDVAENPPTSGATAVITDVETLTPNNVGIAFQVTAVSGASGTFSPAYTPGVSGATTGPLTWTSSSQSGSGSVTFTKQIVLTQSGGFEASATLSDTATVTPAGQSATAAGPVNTTITVNAVVSLTVSKTIPFVLGTGESVSFTFNLFPDGSGPSGTPLDSKTITFNAGDGGTGNPKTATFSGLAANTNYDLYEVAPAGWVDPGKIDVHTSALPACTNTVNVANTFGPASADATKVASPASGTAGWVFTLKKGATTIATGTSASDGSVSWDLASTPGTIETLATVDIAEEGSYAIIETTQPGWDLTTITSTGTGTATPDVPNAQCTFTVNFPADFGKTFSCQFTNVQRGSITIIKDAIPDDPQDFAYTTTSGTDTPLAANFSLDDDADGTLPSSRSFTGLKPGSYSVTETLPVTGWDFTRLTCSSTLGTSTRNVSGATVSITLAAGDSVTCTYVNTKRARVSVIKTENGAVPTTQYTFRLTGGPDGVNITRTTDATNQGVLDFGLLKPSPPDYTLCELAVPAGTHSTLQDLGGVVDPTTGNICLSFALEAGVDRTFTIDNSRPGGGQRTIGYWRNWSSCSGTGNDRVAMAARTGNHLMDEFLPKTLGSYLVDTCQKGYAVLSNPSAKYAENQLAAQLLAAKLNIAAGASHCQQVDAAITHADDLLTGIGYAGPPSAIVGNKHLQRADFLATAALLDNYNNGKIC